ncbi:FT-interacting 1 [Olea europaea subsp. europaea]|uniref:FT-interacting 1 n=1 Tax=Olea europaea subsp. europaea TaxID=158383 RepID=A0A8S0VN94_OLEEU|nr:FT-interacting 1 [Olea europaea subsp. europaea]
MEPSVRIQSSVLEVFVKDKEMVGRDDYLGRVVYDLNEVPTSLLPDKPLAPQWYRQEDRHGEWKVRGEIMLAVWIGTQADEAFTDSWHADAVFVGESHLPKVFVKVQVGNQVLGTGICPTRTANPVWNEDIIFVAAEPFEE